MLHVPERRLLVDLDSRQFARPQYRIRPPDALVLPWDGVDAARRWPWGAIRYRPWPADVTADWQTSGNWAKGPHADVTEALVQAVRKGR